MKKKQMEDALQSDQSDPQKARRVENGLAFKSFWKVCLEKSLGARDVERLTPLLVLYTTKTREAKERFEEFQSFLKDVPLSLALQDWIEGVLNNHSLGEKAAINFARLLQFDVLSLKSEKGKLLTLGDLHLGGVKTHLKVVENIRCVPQWTQVEKDSLVSLYVRFSCDLASLTFDYVLPICDPDKRWAESKLVSYDVFYSFIPFLSERDALISKVLYFGAPSIDEVLSLGVRAIDAEKKSICFESSSVCFPRHMILDLMEHIQSNPNAKGLVFFNVRGEQVERAHLNQSFARASERMPKGVKITPGNLLKFSYAALGKVP